MPEYLARGVFIEEAAQGPRPVEGVATGTAALLRETERAGVKRSGDVVKLTLDRSLPECLRSYVQALGHGRRMRCLTSSPDQKRFLGFTISRTPIMGRDRGRRRRGALRYTGVALPRPRPGCCDPSQSGAAPSAR